MSHLKGLTGFAAVAAACTAMTWGTIARAATPDASSTPTASNFTLEQPIAAQAQYLDDATPPTPWTVQNGLLSKTPIGPWMDQQKLTLNMFAEGSYTYNLRNTFGHFNYQRVFDIKEQEAVINQVDFQLARAVTQGTTWDWGGLVEMQYGGDARFIHSNGLNFYGSNNPQIKPDQQWDLTQAYLTLNAPIGTGLVITAGKFTTLLGYETINPTTNALFSHSYSFGDAIPFTNTGVLGNYQLNNQWAVTAGLTRGWDQALKDNNGDGIDMIGQVHYTSYNVKGLAGYFNFITGPESNDIVPDQVNRYWRSVGEIIVSYAWGDNWTFATDAVFGYEPKAGINGKDANWYGDTMYATYKFNSYLSATGRAEYFNDHDGARGVGAEVYEATAGLEISPFPNNQYLASLLFRPEFRQDWSSSNVFDAGTKANQSTIAADLIYKF